MFNSDFYKLIFENSLDGFWIVDNEGSIINVNQAYCDMIGYSQEEMLKLKVSDIELIDTPEIIKKRIETIKTKGSDNFVTKHKKKNGSAIDVEITATLNTEFDLMVIIIRDITEKKHLQNILEKKKKHSVQHRE